MLRSLLLYLTRNPLSMLGSAITTASAVLILTLFALGLTGFQAGPYIGILAFLILPGFFVLGLLLIPVGAWLQRRKERGRSDEAATEFPVVNLNVPKTRTLVLGLVALSVVNVVILALATYKGIEIMDSTEFCGATCHSVMNPEYTAYQRSPHARVKCVDCHIGPGADWFVKSKLSGTWQVIAVNLDLYPRPIPTPIENLRPARDTCEQCHWPEKFVGDRLKVIPRFQEDEKNTETKTVLLLRVGGVEGVRSEGIHWHVDPSIRIRYRADRTRETIYDVELTRADGTIELFRSGQDPQEGDLAEGWRTMDCVDCHNRPTHIYRAPEDELDRALALGWMDRSLPYIRREGRLALEKEYTSHSEALRGIRDRIRSFYLDNYPEIAAGREDAIEAAAETLGEIYTTNVFPSMNITWGTYPNHVGHRNSPGCFRCHDDEHATEGGKTISQDCDTCHTLLAMEEENPKVLDDLKP